MREFVFTKNLGALGAALYPDWPSVRLAQDDLVWKVPTAPPGGAAGGVSAGEPSKGESIVGFHTDAEYISTQFRPQSNVSVTVWTALDYTDRRNGGLAYIAGSHLLSADLVSETLSEILGGSGFHSLGNGENRDSSQWSAADGLAAALRTRAASEGITEYPPATPELPPTPHNTSEQDDHSVHRVPPFLSVVRPVVQEGHSVLHHEQVVHGSGPNLSSSRHRRALVAHLLRGDVEFRERPSYIYGRYKLRDTKKLCDEFYPTIWGRGLDHGQGTPRGGGVAGGIKGWRL